MSANDNDQVASPTGITFSFAQVLVPFVFANGTAFALFAIVFLSFVYIVFAAPPAATCIKPHTACKRGPGCSYSYDGMRPSNFKEFCHVLEDAILYALEKFDFMQVASKVGCVRGSDGRDSRRVNLRTMESRANESLSHLLRV